MRVPVQAIHCWLCVSLRERNSLVDTAANTSDALTFGVGNTIKLGLSESWLRRHLQRRDR